MSDCQPRSRQGHNICRKTVDGVNPVSYTPSLKGTFVPGALGSQTLFDMIFSSAVQVFLLLAGVRLASAAPQSDFASSDFTRSYSTLVVCSPSSSIPYTVSVANTSRSVKSSISNILLKSTSSRSLHTRAKMSTGVCNLFCSISADG